MKWDPTNHGVGPPPKRYCPAGHDKTIEGISTGGQCIVCHRDHARVKWQQQHHIEPQRGMLAMAPALLWLSNRERTINSLPKHIHRNLHRSRRRGGFTFNAADEFACALGVHPTAIWGPDWFYEEESSA